MTHQNPAPTDLEFVPDSDIQDHSEDWFGHWDLAQVALRILVSVTPPFNVGIFGSWGTGKTSLINLLRSELKNRNIPYVTLDAWKYSADVMRRAFLIKLATDLAPEKIEELEQRLYQDVQETRPPLLSLTLCNIRSRMWTWLKWILFRGILPFLFISFVLLFLLFVIYAIWFGLQIYRNSGAGPIFNWNRPLELFKDVLLVPLLLSAAAMIGDIVRIQVMRVSRSRVDSLEVFESIFNQVIESVKGDRLVIFVDNLDRLADDKMIEALETIKTFLNNPKCIYIVACDDTVVRSVVTRSHPVPDVERADGGEGRERVGEEYLDKFFQFSIRIPPYQEGDIVDFAREQFAKTRLYERLRDLDLDRLLTILLPTGTASPRKVKKLLNEYIVYYQTASEREKANDRGLRPKMLTGYPLFLAKMTVLRTEFPEFYHDLSRNFRLLDYMDRVLDGNWESLEPHQQTLCARFFVTDQENKETNWSEPEPKSRSLIAYLGKTRRVTVPDTLPFLAMRQDLARRELADEHLTRMWQDLANANTTGVREMLKSAETENQMHALVQSMLRNINRMRGIEQSNGLRVLCRLVEDLPVELQPSVAEDLAGLLVNQSQIEDFEAEEVFGVLEHARPHESTRRIAGRFIEDLKEPSDQRTQTIFGATLAHHRLLQRTDHLNGIQAWLNHWLSGEDSTQVSQNLGEFLTGELSNWRDDSEVLLTFFTTSYLDYVTGRLAGRFEDLPEVLPDDETGQQLVAAVTLLAPLACDQDPARFWHLMEELLSSPEPGTFSLALGEIDRHLDRLSVDSVGDLAKTLLSEMEFAESLEDSETWVDRLYKLLLDVQQREPESFAGEAGSQLATVLSSHLENPQSALVEVGLRYLVQFTEAMEPGLLQKPLDATIARMATFRTDADEAMLYLGALLSVDARLSDDWRGKVVESIDPWVRSMDVNQLKTARRLIERFSGYETYHSILRVHVDGWVGLLAPSLAPPRLENLVNIFTACDVTINAEQAARLTTALAQVLRARPGQAPLHPPIIAGLKHSAKRLSPEAARETTDVLLDHHNNLTTGLRWSALEILSELHEYIAGDRRSQYAGFMHQQLSQRPEKSLSYIDQAWSDWDNTQRVGACATLYGALADKDRSILKAKLPSLLSTLDQDSRLAVIYDAVLKFASSPSLLGFFIDDAIPHLGRSEIRSLRGRFLTLLREENADPSRQAAMDFLAQTSKVATDDTEVVRCFTVLYERGEPEVILAARNTSTILADMKLTSRQKDNLAQAMASALKRVTNEPARKIVQAIEELGFLDRWSRQKKHFKEVEDLIENLRGSES